MKWDLVKTDDGFAYSLSRERDTDNYLLTVNEGDGEDGCNWDEVCLSKDGDDVEIKLRHIRYHLDGELSIELRPKAARALANLLIELADKIDNDT